MDERVRIEPAVEPVIQWFKSYSEGAATVGDEIKRFAHDRAERNLDAMFAIASNFANPVKMFEVHERWLRQTVRDYTEETQRLFQISGEVMRDALEQPATMGGEVMRAFVERSKAK